MKNLLFLPILLLFIACGPKESNVDDKQNVKTSTESNSEEQELSITTDFQFGKEFKEIDVKSESDMIAMYKNLKLGDTIQVQFQSEVQSVCAKKGCWMKLKLPGGKPAHITFKDYSFFVPKDSQGHQMLVQGKAFIEQTDVETLKHYAEDAGESKKTIAAITEPELNFRFIADGAKAVR